MFFIWIGMGLLSFSDIHQNPALWYKEQYKLLFY